MYNKIFMYKILLLITDSVEAVQQKMKDEKFRKEKRRPSDVVEDIKRREKEKLQELEPIVTDVKQSKKDKEVKAKVTKNIKDSNTQILVEKGMVLSTSYQPITYASSNSAGVEKEQKRIAELQNELFSQGQKFSKLYDELMELKNQHDQDMKALRSKYEKIIDEKDEKLYSLLDRLAQNKGMVFLHIV